MSGRTTRLIRFFLRVTVAATLLAWVFSRVDLEQFRRTAEAARWYPLLGVWVFTAIFFWVQSLALQLILRKQECDVGVNTLFGASSITALYSLILPGLLSTGIKWYILKRHTRKGSNVLSSMLYNQATLTMVMAVIGLAGLIVTNPTRILFPDARQLWLLPVVCAVVLVFVVLLSLLVLNERTGGMAVRALAAMLQPLPGGIREKGREILMQIAIFQTAGPWFHLSIAFINAVNSLIVGLLIYLFAAWAADVDVSVGVLIWLCAILFVLGKIPISIANLGVREVTLIALLGGYGVGESEALLMSMILFSSLIFMAVIGSAYQLFWAGGKVNDGPQAAAAELAAHDSGMDSSEEIR